MVIEANELAKKIDKELRAKVNSGMNIPKKDLVYRYELYPNKSILVWCALAKMGYKEQVRFLTMP